MSPSPPDAVPPSPCGGLHPPAAAAPAPACRWQVSRGGAVHAGAGSSRAGHGRARRGAAGSMDKLKRVLSGRDAEEPSGLSEVTLLCPAPASLAGTGRCAPGPGRQLVSGSWRERSGARVPGPPLNAAAAPWRGSAVGGTGLGCAASSRRWASGSLGRNRPVAAEGELCLEPVLDLSLELKPPGVRDQLLPLGEAARGRGPRPCRFL